MAQNLNIGQDKITRLFVSYAVPSVVSMLGTSIFIVIDGIIIGQFIGPTGLAVVNLAMPFMYLTWALAAMISSGGLAQATIELGRGDRQAARDRFSLAAAILVGLYLLFLLLALIWGPEIALLSGADANLAPDVTAYLQLLLAFTIFWCGSIYLDMGMRAMGQPRLAMLANLAAAILNTMFDLLFVGVFHWGIRGAALASGLGFILSFAIMLRQYFLPEAQLRFQRFAFRLKIVLKIMANGSSEAMGQLSIGITTLLFNLALMARIGEEGVAAFSIILYLHELLVAVTLGIASAIIPIISFNYGAKQPGRVLATLKTSLLAVLLIGSISTVAIYLGSDLLAGVFSREASLIDLTATALRLYAPCYLFIGINIIASAYFTAMEDALRSALISSERSLIFILPGLWLLPLLFGNNGIWMVVPTSEIVTLLCSVPLMIYSVRRLRQQNLLLKMR